jgi:PEP-CTERM motif
LGWALYDGVSVGSNLFGEMAFPNFGSTGFSVPLAAGSYTLWIQELATGDFPYNFNLTLTPVPEPSAAWLMLLGLAAAAGARRSARRLPGR